MSWMFKEGQIVRFGETAVYDAFARANVMEITLRRDDGSEEQARVPVGAEFETPEYLHERPAIGDRVRVGWDYQNFSGKIMKFQFSADNRAELLPLELPVAGRQVGNFGDIIDSLKPETDAEQRIAADLFALFAGLDDFNS